MADFRCEWANGKMPVWSCMAMSAQALECDKLWRLPRTSICHKIWPCYSILWFGIHLRYGAHDKHERPDGHTCCNATSTKLSRQALIYRNILSIFFDLLSSHARTCQFHSGTSVQWTLAAMLCSINPCQEFINLSPILLPLRLWELIYHRSCFHYFFQTSGCCDASL